MSLIDRLEEIVEVLDEVGIDDMLLIGIFLVSVISVRWYAIKVPILGRGVSEHALSGGDWLFPALPLFSWRSS